MQPETVQITPRLPRLRLFCLVLIVLPLAAFAGAIALARSDWFIQRAVPPYLKMIDQESGVRGRDCDVLFYGDSAALTGIMPWVIQRDTGLSTCSIAQTKGTVGVSGLQFLREYLAVNPAPKILVLAFSPEDWRPIRQWGEVAYVEGVLQLVRRSSFRVYAPALARHPNESFGFVTFVYKSALQSLLSHGRSAQWPAGGTVREGHMTLPAPVESACIGDDAHALPGAITPSPEYVQRLRHEFATPETKVLLVSPDIPDCDPRRDMFAGQLDAALDQPIQHEPIGNYNDSDRHFTAQAAEIYSRRLAILIRRKMESGR